MPNAPCTSMMQNIVTPRCRRLYKSGKNFLLILSLLISIVGLVLIYFASVNIEPKKITVSDITADMEGRRIITTGYIVEKRGHKDGHLFLTISDNKTKIQVPLFSDFMNSLNQIGITEKDFKLNDRISVKGILENYKGSLQIVPKSLNDVKILGD